MTIINQLSKLFLFVIIFVSCTKTKLSDPLPPSPSPLSGKEFIFDNLIWEGYSSAFESEVYFITPSLSGLLQNGETFKYGWLQDAEVQIKFDTANAWINIKPGYYYDNTLPVQYLYNIINASSLIVNVWPDDFSLVGKKSSLKINFK